MRVSLSLASKFSLDRQARQGILDNTSNKPKCHDSKSIFTGASKTPLKTRPALILGSGFKLVYHRWPEKRAGAPSSPN
jgi:hypothetical protein